MKLKTSLPTFNSLHERVNPDRGRSPKNVTLSRQELMDLLMDHSAMAAGLKEVGIRVE